MKIHEIITPDFDEKVVLNFLEIHAEIADDQRVKDACAVLLDYVRVYES